MYLLDTNAVIDLFKGRGGVAERVLATPPAEIVLFELEVGAEESDRRGFHRQQIASFAELATFLPFGAAEARMAVAVRARLEASGLRMGPYDTLIAATALVAGATLVTHNADEYRRVQDLRVEDWF